MTVAKEFVPSFKALSSSPVLRSSGQAVVNTIDLTICGARCLDTNDQTISASKKVIGSSGHYSYISSSENIHQIVFTIPKNALPTSGKYKFSYSWMSDVAYSYQFVAMSVYENRQNAATGSAGSSSLRPDYIDNAGNFVRSPVVIDFTSVSNIEIIGVIDGAVDAVGGKFAVRFQLTEDAATADLGYARSDSNNTALIQENTAQLVYSQNETNGLLEDIIQHISDQLAAMWDQIYNLMAVPWIQNDNQRTNNTIDAIEDSSESTNTTIEQQSSWHANFIIDGLKSLFIPSETYFSTTITDLFDWFEDKFGFLGYTLTYFIRLLNGIVGASQNTVIRFPGITVPNRATNETYQILPAQDVDLAAQISLISDNDFNLLEFMRTAGDIVLVLGFIVMLQNKLHEVESR